MSTVPIRRSRFADEHDVSGLRTPRRSPRRSEENPIVGLFAAGKFEPADHVIFIGSSALSG